MDNSLTDVDRHIYLANIAMDFIKVPLQKQCFTKQCAHNNDKSKKINAQSLLLIYKENDLVKQEVFPIMRADEISYTTKTDSLICAVAKSHRDKQFRLVLSRKMRQLATLLNEIRKKASAKSLLQALDPANFDIIVDNCNTA